MARETKIQKSQRLVADDKIRFSLLTTGMAVAGVRGDTADYVTMMTHPGKWTCNCTKMGFGGTCSHIEAAKAIYRMVAPALR